jgi:deazaflavin-dependent oxidoreductase (nitroreductase family)
MAAKDQPDSAPDVPVVFPPWVSRLQIKYINPMMRPVAPYLPGFSIIKHRGRRSGKPYETVVNAYTRGPVLAIALGHGKADWVKNVLTAGEADVHFTRRDVHITNPRILPIRSASDSLPRMARLLGRWEPVLVADIACT